MATVTRTRPDEATWRDKPTLPGLYVWEADEGYDSAGRYGVVELQEDHIACGAPFCTKRVFGPIQK